MSEYPAARSTALTAIDAMGYLAVAWHNKLSTVELEQIATLRARFEALAGGIALDEAGER